MAKVRLVLYKRPNVGWDEFRAYWSENRAALVANIPGVRRYVHHQLALGGRPSDNVAELWFDSHEAMRSAIDSSEGQRALADIASAFDPTKMGMIVVEDWLTA
jgi:uncharacterized protein (TIGR02118 family)